jgi:hypothetical protein
MTLHDVILSDASAVFTNTDDFAEVVTYHARQQFGGTVPTPRAINVVVIREQITSLDGDTVSPVWQVHVANDFVLGIASTELDLGGDQIELPPRDGKTAERRTITQLLIQDHGMLVLECR